MLGYDFAPTTVEFTDRHQVPLTVTPSDINEAVSTI